MIDTAPGGWSVNRKGLLCDLFRLLALLEVIETTFSLTTESQRAQQLIITGFAIISSFGNDYRHWRPKLYALLGLLLRPPFLNETEGTALCMFVQTDLG